MGTRDPQPPAGDYRDMNALLRGQFLARPYGELVPAMVAAVAIGGVSNLAGCAPACDTSAHASVYVTTVDVDGNPIELPGVEYRAAGEHDDPFDPASCESGADGAACSQWVAGYELAGDIEIQVKGCATSAIVVTVAEDECHVLTQSVDLTVPAQCLPSNG